MAWDCLLPTALNFSADFRLQDKGEMKPKTGSRTVYSNQYLSPLFLEFVSKIKTKVVAIPLRH